MLLRPAEALVEMALVAGVGPPGLDAGRHRGVGNLVAADGLQQPVGRVRHVAVVAAAPRAVGGVVRVLGYAIAEVAVALQAGPVAEHARRELIIRIAVVHRMAGEATELAALITGRLDQAVVFPPRDADHAVPP